MGRPIPSVSSILNLPEGQGLTYAPGCACKSSNSGSGLANQPMPHIHRQKTSSSYSIRDDNRPAIFWPPIQWQKSVQVSASSPSATSKNRMGRPLVLGGKGKGQGKHSLSCSSGIYCCPHAPPHLRTL